MAKTRVLPALVLVALLGGCGSHGGSPKAQGTAQSTWTSKSFGIALQHPAGWKPAAGYLARLQGRSGFVALNALQGSGLTPRSAAQSQAQQALQPFGAHPRLQSMHVDGQPAYVILPSGAAPSAQAEAVVLYPKPQTISGVPYRYLVVTSTSKDILPIVRSIRFVRR
jgi:hypothetical protein